MTKILLAPFLVLGLLIGWLWVQDIARRFAARHPQFGPAREEGGCGRGACGQCGGKDCHSGF